MGHIERRHEKPRSAKGHIVLSREDVLRNEVASAQAELKEAKGLLRWIAAQYKGLTLTDLCEPEEKAVVRKLAEADYLAIDAAGEIDYPKEE